MKALILALAAALPLTSALAADSNKIVVADTAQAFSERVEYVHKQMETGGRFEYIKPADKQAVNSDLDSMMAMLQKSGSVSAMGADERVKLLNTQEHLNGLLTHSDSERLVCERTNPVGSHIPTTTCRTYGEIEREHQQSEKYLDTQRNTVQTRRSN